ncbi:MarR family winged helix-turn-helix transcriptional regulator [Pseudoroseomonas cervicalis]|uniref:MarR family winged helix-turn-helix transcriptional regulator n=1 Tax=Teichococcus cervicalis TaxID=204525 RepID=UPI0027850AF2|nr:MarR family transcriptional regulator [Pseudoroseomonas cervicalis]MDQ1079673.1 DNA-binding MarR family transcriptional regulator [Pseudoroseomonas cervicalis]
MSDPPSGSGRDQLGAWAKQCYFAGRALMDATLRPYELGSAQWYVLHHLAQAGPTPQRELVRLLQVERATLSGIVAALLRKGLVAQEPDREDQRQKRLCLTQAGAQLWQRLPDLTVIRSIAFDGLEEAEIATAIHVLRSATERLEAALRQGGGA